MVVNMGEMLTEFFIFYFFVVVVVFVELDDKTHLIFIGRDHHLVIIRGGIDNSPIAWMVIVYAEIFIDNLKWNRNEENYNNAL